MKKLKIYKKMLLAQSDKLPVSLTSGTASYSKMSVTIYQSKRFHI
jgi:hypothetical protein